MFCADQLEDVLSIDQDSDHEFTAFEIKGKALEPMATPGSVVVIDMNDAHSPGEPAVIMTYDDQNFVGVIHHRTDPRGNVTGYLLANQDNTLIHDIDADDVFCVAPIHSLYQNIDSFLTSSPLASDDKQNDDTPQMAMAISTGHAVLDVDSNRMCIRFGGQLFSCQDGQWRPHATNDGERDCYNAETATMALEEKRGVMDVESGEIFVYYNEQLCSMQNGQAVPCSIESLSERNESGHERRYVVNTPDWKPPKQRESDTDQRHSATEGGTEGVGTVNHDTEGGLSTHNPPKNHAGNSASLVNRASKPPFDAREADRRVKRMRRLVKHVPSGRSFALIQGELKVQGDTSSWKSLNIASITDLCLDPDKRSFIDTTAKHHPERLSQRA